MPAQSLQKQCELSGAFASASELIALLHFYQCGNQSIAELRIYYGEDEPGGRIGWCLSAQVNSEYTWAFCLCSGARLPPSEGWELADAVSLNVVVQDPTEVVEELYKKVGQAMQ